MNGKRIDKEPATRYPAYRVDAALAALRIGEGDGGWTYNKVRLDCDAYEIHAHDEDGNFCGKF